jgi:Ca2+-binding RTX toxin-like protein
MIQIRALTQNGFWIDANTLGGPDTLFSPFVGATTLFGGAGADYLVTRSTTGTLAFGEGDSDMFESFAYESLLFGGAGNDTFCLKPNAYYVDGGDGSDRMCGTASTVETVETSNPGDCNAFCSIILE